MDRLINLIPFVLFIDVVAFIVLLPIFHERRKKNIPKETNRIFEIKKYKDSKAKVYGIGSDNASKKTD